MNELSKKELLRFIDYDEKKVVTYLLTQAGLYKEDSEEYKLKTIAQLTSVFSFISEERNHLWTLVIVK